jgi:hypothetical protein
MHKHNWIEFYAVHFEFAYNLNDKDSLLLGQLNIFARADGDWLVI